MSLGFAKVVKAQLLGKEVEIYQGETHESLLKADKNIERKSIIRGILIDVIEECLIIECKVNMARVKVYLNSWSIQSILEPVPGIHINNIYRNAEFRKDM